MKKSPQFSKNASRVELSHQQIRERVKREFFKPRILDNSLRGLWCECMIAQAIGTNCKVVSSGWWPWDLQLGPDHAQFPERIRIQVKSSARIQLWNQNTDQRSDSLFNLTYRPVPSYFEADYESIPCETMGFMCDLFALCFHDQEDVRTADQTDPAQWVVFLVPTNPELGAITDLEIAYAQANVNSSGRPSSLQRRPSTLKKGIRNRRPVQPIPVVDLTEQTIFASLGLA